MDDDFVGSLIGGGIMSLSEIITDGLSIVTAAGSAFSSLDKSFGGVLYVPIALAVAGSIIGIVKGILFFRRGRRGR